MTHDPLDRTTLVRLARAALARLDFTGALEVLFKVEHDEETRVLLARAYRNSARPREARKLLEPLAESSPDAATELGLLELALGHHEHAHALFARALENDDFEGHADAIHGLAYLAEARTRGREREEVYALLTRGLERHPGHHVLLQTLGIAYLNDGRVAEATEIFAEVIAVRASPPWSGTRFEVEAHGNMACALVAAGRIDDALEAVERTMEVCPRWFRQGMAMAMQSDPDLSAIHDHPKFLASMAYRYGATREERIATAKAAIAEREAGPPPLPSPATLDADARSGDETRVDRACRMMHELVSAREEIWEDHGWCEQRVRDCAERVIVTSLRDVTWLHEAAMAAPSSAKVELASLLVGSHDESLRAVGAPLGQALLERWLPTDGGALVDLLDALGWEDTRAKLSSSAPLLAAAHDGSAEPVVRRLALEALVQQGESEDAAQLLVLVEDDAVAATAVETIHALDASRLDPVPLLDRAATRFVTACTYTDTLADHFDTLLEILHEPREDHARRELLRKLMKLDDARLVPAVFAESTHEHSTYWCLAWLRSQSLNDEQLATLMSMHFEAERVAGWLAAIARAQGRWLTIPNVAALPSFDDAPTEGSAELIGYAGVRERLPWLRDHVATANRRTMRGIVIALGLLGDGRDAELLEQLGLRVSWLADSTALSRALLGEDLVLLREVVPRTPYDLWALERLVERHGMAPVLSAAADRAAERGLHNEDLIEFRRVLARLRRR